MLGRSVKEGTRVVRTLCSRRRLTNSTVSSAAAHILRPRICRKTQTRKCAASLCQATEPQTLPTEEENQEAAESGEIEQKCLRIADLNPQLTEPWCIKAKVISRSEMVKASVGKQSLFFFTLEDESGRISAACRDPVASQIYEKIVCGQTYEINYTSGECLNRRFQSDGRDQSESSYEIAIKYAEMVKATMSEELLKREAELERCLDPIRSISLLDANSGRPWELEASVVGVTSGESNIGRPYIAFVLSDCSGRVRGVIFFNASPKGQRQHSAVLNMLKRGNFVSICGRSSAVLPIIDPEETVGRFGTQTCQLKLNAETTVLRVVRAAADNEYSCKDMVPEVVVKRDVHYEETSIADLSLESEKPWLVRGKLCYLTGLRQSYHNVHYKVFGGALIDSSGSIGISAVHPNAAPLYPLFQLGQAYELRGLRKELRPGKPRHSSLRHECRIRLDKDMGIRHMKNSSLQHLPFLYNFTPLSDLQVARTKELLQCVDVAGVVISVSALGVKGNRSLRDFLEITISDYQTTMVKVVLFGRHAIAVDQWRNAKTELDLPIIAMRYASINETGLRLFDEDGELTMDPDPAQEELAALRKRVLRTGAPTLADLNQPLASKKIDNPFLKLKLPSYYADDTVEC